MDIKFGIASKFNSFKQAQTVKGSSEKRAQTSKTYGSRPNFERNITRIDLGNVLGQMLFKHSKKYRFQLCSMIFLW